MKVEQIYRITAYQAGFDGDQARIGSQIAKDWIWPYAYDLEDLLSIHAQPDFDPGTHLYCFLGDEMVGYLSSNVTPASEVEAASATLDFPRMLPGHELAGGLLLQYALEVLKKKGVRRVTGRVTSMCPGDIRLAEEAGFSTRDWGYKVYYSYQMSWGRLDIPPGAAEEIDPAVDLEACASLAALWYRRPVEWCHSRLQQWHTIGLITHAAVRERGKLVAACLAAPNLVRHSTAANYYIYAPNRDLLILLLAHVIEKCIDFSAHNLIVDLIHEHRQYEPVYHELGFEKVADWARCELVLG